MKWLRFLLVPFSALYYVITSVRNVLFSLQILKSTSFTVPTIAVGNLSTGGTGKTPQVEYLIRLLQKRYNLAVLSRGYGRKTSGFVLADATKTAEDIGDEPLQFFKKFDTISVAVNANRVQGVLQLLALKKPPNVILLDDAFQHRKIRAHFYLLLTPYSDLFIDDFLLPVGNLREPRNGANRADAIVVTKCPENIAETTQKKIEKRLQKRYNKSVFFTRISYAAHIKNAAKQTILVADLKNYEIVLVTGIANPNPLLAFLAKQQCVYKHVKYADHHAFTKKDILQIKNHFAAVQTDKKLILTTEKDFVRLSQLVNELYYIEIATKFINKQQDFDDLIMKTAANNL